MSPLLLLRLVIAACALFIAPPALLAQDQLVLLKTVKLDLGAGIEFVDLTEAKGAYRAVRVRVIEGSVTLTDVVMSYADGNQHSEARRILLNTGERTREINPTAEAKFLNEITLEFIRNPGRAAVVEIYGRQTPEDASRDRPQELASAPGKKKKKGGGGTRSVTTPAEAVAPRTEPARSAAPTPSVAEPLACVAQNTCTPVQVFFGTNRQREDLPTRIAFGWKDAGAVALGSAVVTVPRQVRRKSGQVLLPTWWDKYVLRVPQGGDPARHFVIVADRFKVYSDEAAFLAEVARHMAEAGAYKDHVFVFVHGYRVSFDDALYRTAQIAYDLGEARQEDGVVVPFGTPFLYSWPSAGALKDYPYDQESSRLSVRHLEQFIDMVRSRTGAKNIHLVAHSMGNVAMLNALGRLAARGTAGAKINQVILAAPDMGTREFKDLADQIKPLATGFTLYASSSDAALEASRRVHKNEQRAGDVVDGKPVIAGGIDTIDISAITDCYFCFGHDEYVNQPTLLNDIAQLVHKGIRPPHSRTESFRVQSETGGQFWRYLP